MSTVTLPANVTVTTDQVKGLICFDFELIEGLELRCNFQHGPENVNCESKHTTPYAGSACLLHTCTLMSYVVCLQT